MNLNSKQRIILIAGAAAFLYVMFTSPKISIVKGTYIIPPSDKKDIARVVDIRTAMIRAVAVLGATLLVSTALKDKEKPRTPTPMDRNPVIDGVERDRPKLPKREVLGKIIGFLKDFF